VRICLTSDIDAALEAMLEARRGKYPKGYESFAKSDQTFSESRHVDAMFLGRTVEEVDVLADIRFVDAPFMIPEALAYYWPRILQGLLRAPGSLFAERVIGLVLNPGVRPNRYKALRHLTPEEIEVTVAVIERILPVLIDPTTVQDARAFIEHFGRSEGGPDVATSI
jgi:hypothetical protein